MTAVSQRSFAGGEIAPSLYARTDTTKYSTGCRTCRNMMVQKHGGVTNRPGTEFVGETVTPLSKVRLIPFNVSATESYVLEFGTRYVRFYQNGARVRVTGVLAWNIATNYVVGDLVVQAGINYQCKLANIAQAPPNLTYWYPLTDDIYEVESVYREAELPNIRFVQSNDTLTLTYKGRWIRELKRVSATNWQFTIIKIGPNLPAGSGFAAVGGGVGAALYWLITGLDSETFEEGPAAGGSAVNAVPSAGTPTALSWTAIPGAFLYNVYRSIDGARYGFIGRTTINSFSDIGTDPNYDHPSPFDNRDPLGNDTALEANSTNHPVAVGFYQQRRIFANRGGTQAETVWGSKTGLPNNFNTSFPVQDDDAVTFTMVGRRRNAVQHLLDLGRLVVFTENEEKVVDGDVSGILRPDAINPRKLSSNGCGALRPIEIDDTAIYVQARGTIIRDLKPIGADGYEGTDLTVFAGHLFEGYSIADWDYALNPNSIVWAVRSDGVLLGLTYLREHGIFGWHRHDTDGVVENVCAIPEGAYDRVYLVVRRTINGVAKRYVERMALRFFTEKEAAFFVDCGLSYDGRNTGADTVKLSGGVAWNESELLTATASVAKFTVDDIGNVIIFPTVNASGEAISLRFTIEGYTSATVVTGRSSGAVPASLHAIATTNWSLAKKTMSGLDHLEGKSLSVLGDGYVVASPNNTGTYPEVVVTAGVATFPDAYAVIHAGLPYISDLVTLDLDSPGPTTIKDKKMLVNRLGIFLQATRGVWAGMPDQPTDDNPINGLQELEIRELEDYDEPTDPVTDYVEIRTESDWNTNGRQMVRQVDPLPMTILSISPIGDA